MYRVVSCLVASVFFCGGAAAQTPPAKVNAEDTRTAGAARFPLSELRAFATATRTLQARPLPAEDQRAVIEGAGLTVERYNEISQAVQSDPAVLKQVQLLSTEAAKPGPADQTVAALPPLPTTGDAAQLVQTLEGVCAPAVEKDQDVAALAPKAGFKPNRKDGAYHRPLGQRQHEIIVAPRGANQTVCSVQVRYPPGGEGEFRKVLHLWAARHSPAMQQVRNDVVVGPDGLQRTTYSWAGGADNRTYALVWVEVRKGDGASLDSAYDQATLLYSMTPA